MTAWNSLRCVLNDHKSMPLGDGHQTVHVADPPVQVHGEEGLGARRDSAFDPVWIDRVVLLHIHEDWCRTAVYDGRYGSHKGVCDRNHFVALRNATR